MKAEVSDKNPILLSISLSDSKTIILAPRRGILLTGTSWRWLKSTMTLTSKTTSEKANCNSLFLTITSWWWMTRTWMYWVQQCFLWPPSCKEKPFEKDWRSGKAIKEEVLSMWSSFGIKLKTITKICSSWKSKESWVHRGFMNKSVVLWKNIMLILKKSLDWLTTIRLG